MYSNRRSFSLLALILTPMLVIAEPAKTVTTTTTYPDGRVTVVEESYPETPFDPLAPAPPTHPYAAPAPKPYNPPDTTSTRPQYSPLDCNIHALNYVERHRHGGAVWRRGAGGALGGAAIGAAIGNSDDAARGAAIGGLLGAWGGAYHDRAKNNQLYQRAYNACLNGDLL